jgi:hypothetical protein
MKMALQTYLSNLEITLNPKEVEEIGITDLKLSNSERDCVKKKMRNNY